VPDIPLLPAHYWDTTYRHEQGDLVRLFYVPALSCAVQYDRMTGYFTADALALAARGIERLIANRGRMRLLVGCTLDAAEIAAIEQGYDLKQQVEDQLLREPLTPPDPAVANGLAALAWMIGHDLMEIKVAIPADASGRPCNAFGIYHEKVGIIADQEGNRISFSGSINETRGGWVNNRESFHVHCSWEGGREARHVGDEVQAFERFWRGEASSVLVFEFPDAVRQRLLEFLPREDRIVGLAADLPVAAEIDPAVDMPAPAGSAPAAAAVKAADEPPPASELPAVPDPASRVLPDDLRRLVWTWLRWAPSTAQGLRVGEVTSAIRPWPHQVRAFKRLLDNWPCQMLIADEVGLGKTITAGMVIRQAWISGLARRILVLVPKAVMVQWQDELYEKFNLNVPIYDGQRLLWKHTHGWQGPLERRVDRNRWHAEPFVIASSHLMRRRDRAAELQQAADWDLLVTDEAHHARRRAPGSPQEGGPNKLLRLLQDLRPKCRALLLLTATPMQVHPVELWDLLRLLGLPGRWGQSRDLFLRYFAGAAGNPNQAELEFLRDMFLETEREFGVITEEQVAGAAEGLTSIARSRILKALHDSSAIPLKRQSAPERTATLKLLRRFSPIRHLMSRHTRSLLREYHRRGLIDSPIATRDVRDIEVEMTRAERLLYDAVQDYISTTYNNAAEDKRSAVGFVMTIYRRRLASSFEALKKTLANRLEGMQQGEPPITDEDVSQDEQRDEVMDVEEAADLARSALVDEERESILNLLKQIEKVGGSSKARRLVSELADGWAAGYTSAIIFTQYTDTMDWLRDFLGDQLPGEPLASYSGRGGEIRDLSGQWQPCSKEQIKLRLKTGRIRILLCTDAAAEGLNFQSCGFLVNYDLPWNPMKVEQRIGRIDRIGQKYPLIRILNLASRDTVEADIYFALGQRINLFQGLVGRLQPILSRLPQQFETLTLTDKPRRAADRARILADVEQAATQSDPAGVDIDEVAEEAFVMPTLPAPALTFADIDRVMNRSDLRPPAIEWTVLDQGTYGLSLPGLRDRIRVTTRPEIFEDQSENHILLGPGNWLYDQLVREAGEVPPEQGAEVDGAATSTTANVYPTWHTPTGPISPPATMDELLLVLRGQVWLEWD
jgi:SNF2 family DNA or RNA helicase